MTAKVWVALRYETNGSTRALDLITQISPVAWRHLLLNGHYTFHSGHNLIELDELIAGLNLG